MSTEGLLPDRPFRNERQHQEKTPSGRQWWRCVPLEELRLAEMRAAAAEREELLANYDRFKDLMTEGERGAVCAVLFIGEVTPADLEARSRLGKRHGIEP